MKIHYLDNCVSCHAPAFAHTVGVFRLIKNGEVTSIVEKATLEKVNKNIFTGGGCRKFMPDNLKYLEDLYEKRSR
jgi:hypothetical protein